MRPLIVSLALFASPAAAAPSVVADIPPVASLVAQVMEGVGSPRLVTPGSASPHGHALRPSDAAALEDAELLVWVGPSLTPWLAEARQALAPEAGSLVLLEVPGTRLLELGEHGHAHGSADTHAEAEHGHGAAPADGEHAEGEHADGEHAGEEHAGEAHAGEEHAHGPDEQAGEHAEAAEPALVPAGAEPVDPHAWLDPENAKLWLAAIAERLAAADPENAGRYRENAEAGVARIDAATARVDAALAPVRGAPYAVYHDAYRYFEARFGLAGGLPFASGDAETPGPASLAGLRDDLAASGARCLFAEPQFDASRAAPLTEGMLIEVAVLDPLGARLEPGPDLYPTLLEDLAESLATCLGRDAS